MTTRMHIEKRRGYPFRTDTSPKYKSNFLFKILLGVLGNIHKWRRHAGRRGWGGGGIFGSNLCDVICDVHSSIE